jgi:Domain of unknown function (DUF4148)
MKDRNLDHLCLVVAAAFTIVVATALAQEAMQFADKQQASRLARAQPQAEPVQARANGALPVGSDEATL